MNELFFKFDELFSILWTFPKIGELFLKSMNFFPKLVKFFSNWINYFFILMNLFSKSLNCFQSDELFFSNSVNFLNFFQNWWTLVKIDELFVKKLTTVLQIHKIISNSFFLMESTYLHICFFKVNILLWVHELFKQI